jgi:hypothetical protein
LQIEAHSRVWSSNVLGAALGKRRATMPNIATDSRLKLSRRCARKPRGKSLRIRAKGRARYLRHLRDALLRMSSGEPATIERGAREG